MLAELLHVRQSNDSNLTEIVNKFNPMEIFQLRTKRKLVSAFLLKTGTRNWNIELLLDKAREELRKLFMANDA